MTRINAAAFLIVTTVTISGCSEETPNGPPFGPGSAGPAKVGYVVAREQSVPLTAELPGRVVALATAEIRPQVNGIVRSIELTEGRPMKAGDILFHLDDTRFKAALAASTAAVAKAEASQAGAQLAFNRAERLAATSAVSQQTLDDARTTLQQAQADVAAAEADLQSSQINLDNTTIRAPIDGIIGVAKVSVGSLVTENQTDAMATVQQIDPIHVDLVDSSANLLRIRQQVDSGVLGRERDVAPTVKLTLENGQVYDSIGSVSLATIDVSQSTGTFTVRSSFPNANRVLLPGMYVRASVNLGNIKRAILVPQRAVQRGSKGEPTAYIASTTDKAELRVLKTMGTIDNKWIVSEGISDGERIIVDGFQKISAGIVIHPIEVEIDADGVVHQSLEQDDPPASGDQK